jgi:hypothetical protein
MGSGAFAGPVVSRQIVRAMRGTTRHKKDSEGGNIEPGPFAQAAAADDWHETAMSPPLAANRELIMVAGANNDEISAQNTPATRRHALRGASGGRCTPSVLLAPSWDGRYVKGAIRPFRNNRSAEPGNTASDEKRHLLLLARSRTTKAPPCARCVLLRAPS